METIELLPHLRFREVQKILDELLRQRLIDPVMYDMVLSMDVQYILRQERYTPDSQSIISRVESPWLRPADNDTSVQSQPPWPGTTQ